MTLPLLEVQVPDPSIVGFRLNYSALDANRLPIDTRRAFTLDLDSLKGTASGLDSRLAPLPIDPEWVDLIGPSTSIRAFQGGRADTLLRTPEVGTLTATMLDAPDFRALGVRYGTPIRLRVALHGQYQTIWQGRVDTVTEHWDGVGTNMRKTSTLTANDGVEIAGAVTRYGATTTQSADHRALALRGTLARYMPNTSISLDSPSTLPTVPGTVLETSVLNHVQILATSCRRMLIARQQAATNAGPVAATFRGLDLEGTSGTYVWATFSDKPDADRSYYAIERDGGSAGIVSAVELTNHRIGADGNALNETTTFEDATLVAEHGLRTERVDVCADPAQLPDIAAWLLDQNAPRGMSIRSIEIAGDIGYWSDEYGNVVDLDTGFGIDVELLGVTYPVTIIGIEHDLTPLADPPFFRHRTTYRLRPRKA